MRAIARGCLGKPVHVLTNAGVRGCGRRGVTQQRFVMSPHLKVCSVLVPNGFQTSRKFGHLFKSL